MRHWQPVTARIASILDALAVLGPRKGCRDAAWRQWVAGGNPIKQKYRDDLRRGPEARKTATQLLNKYRSQ